MASFDFVPHLYRNKAALWSYAGCRGWTITLKMLILKFNISTFKIGLTSFILRNFSGE
jgi:hypothetical protein